MFKPRALKPIFQAVTQESLKIRLSDCLQDKWRIVKNHEIPSNTSTQKGHIQQNIEQI